MNPNPDWSGLDGSVDPARGSGRQKKDISWFKEELCVLFEEMEASPGAWKSFVESWEEMYSYCNFLFKCLTSLKTDLNNVDPGHCIFGPFVNFLRCIYILYIQCSNRRKSGIIYKQYLHQVQHWETWTFLECSRQVKLFYNNLFFTCTGLALQTETKYLSTTRVCR